ncbi:MAG: hypothetical protein HY695_28185 [Deltaproteobacteria bacterium]|nr:hypothetical protein [Deltaproteobacteria bacterium]
MEWKQASPIEGGFSIPPRWVYLRYYEAFNLLFRIENALRVFVYIVLKNELRDKWAEAQVVGDDEQGTISSLAKKRMGQAQTFGYLGHSIASPVMHLNSGELTRLIVSEGYWKLFKPYFLGSKEIIKSKLDEIGSIRNSLAHFRPIRADDVDVIKQNSKHVLLGIEQFLNQVLNQSDVIPTNTADEWYKNLKTLGTDQCVFSFQQSTDEQWARISMEYACPVIKKEGQLRPYMSYTVLTIRSSAVLTKYPEIAKDVCYLSESPSYPIMLKEQDAKFTKTLSFVLSRSMLVAQHESLKKSLEELLLTVSNETELIQQDHLARGELVHSVPVSASYRKEEQGGRWEWYFYRLHTPVIETDPPEYWGSLRFYGWGDFIAATDKYPWMPEAVFEEELPF